MWNLLTTNNCENMYTKFEDIAPNIIYKMREDLALKLGWKQNLGGHWKHTTGLFSTYPPNYFYDDDDRKELTAWLTSNDELWFLFRLELASVLVEENMFPEDWAFERALLAAPQKLVAYAAWLTLK